MTRETAELHAKRKITERWEKHARDIMKSCLAMNVIRFAHSLEIEGGRERQSSNNIKSMKKIICMFHQVKMIAWKRKYIESQSAHTCHLMNALPWFKR